MTGDEVVKVRTRVPRSIILACTTNAVFLFAYAICLLYNLGDPDEVSASPLPILIVYYQATGSKPAANLLASMLVIVFFFALFNMLASVSRLVWVFAKDSGLPFSKQLAYVSRTSSALTYLRCPEERKLG
jgi:choline transport protein